MKLSSIFLTVFALATTGLAAKTCTPSFDYCSDVLIKDKGNLFPVTYMLYQANRRHNRVHRGRSEGGFEGIRSRE